MQAQPTQNMDPRTERPNAASPYSARTHEARLSPAERFVLAFGGALVVLATVWIVFRFGGQTTTAWVVDVLQFGTMGLMAGAGFFAARRSVGRVRLAWTLVGGAGSVWFFGQCLWVGRNYYGVFVGEPYETIMALAYLAGTPLLVFAAANLFGQTHTPTSIYRRLADAALVVGSLLIVFWLAYLGDALAQLASHDAITLAYLFTYPIGDAIILGLIAILFLRMRPEMMRRLWPAPVGLFFLAVADLSYAFAQSKGFYDPTAGFVVGWVVAELLIAWAAVRPVPVMSPKAATHERVPGFGTPVLLAPLIAMGFLLLRFFQGHAIDEFLLVMVAAVFGALALRHLLHLRELTQAAKSRERALRAERDLKERNEEVEKLREMNVFKTNLLNVASHELNTPIGALKLQLFMLKTRLGPDIGQANADGIALLERNVERLAKLVTETLDVARIESGNLQIRPQAIDMVPLIGEVTASLQSVAEEKKINVVWSPRAPLPAHADASRVSQILFNLLGNALKFTPSGGTVQVSAQQTPTGVQVSVRDNGRGMRADQIRRLFQPFSQVHDSTQSTTGGTGLGLYISRGIVESHGGTISCTSEGPGRGCTFSFTLPQTISVQPPVVAVRDIKARLPTSAA